MNNYLGIVFTKTGKFNVTKKCLVDKATRALYEVLKLGCMYKLKIKCQLDLFDKMVKPILLFGCEVWGFGDNDIIERAHLKFCKLLLLLLLVTWSTVNWADTLLKLILN